MLSSHERPVAESGLKRSLKKFKTLKRRALDLQNSETAQAHKEKMIDSFDTIEIIEDLLLEAREAEFGETAEIEEDINYYLSQLEENVHDLERDRSMVV